MSYTGTCQTKGAHIWFGKQISIVLFIIYFMVSPFSVLPPAAPFSAPSHLEKFPAENKEKKKQVDQ
jgi:hypothetical protein